jgi:hypothetical protein
MKSVLSSLVALVVGVLVLAAPSLAHHGTAEYNEKNPITLTGTVTEYQFANPHVLVYFDVKDANGKIQKWAAEIGAPINIRRTSGWTPETLKVGDTITITGGPAQNGSHTMISTPARMLVNGKKIVSPE